RRIGGKGKGNRYIKSTFGPSGAFPSRFHQYIARDTLTSIIKCILSFSIKFFRFPPQVLRPTQRLFQLSNKPLHLAKVVQMISSFNIIVKLALVGFFASLPEVLACSGQTSTLACWNAGWEQPDPSGPGGCPYGASVLCCRGDPLTQTNPRPSCIYPNGAIFHVPSHPKRFKL
ncbi:hypothetical protein MJO29_016090, partial [Puccinia striiformis f. sp. tritici]